ncbi:hypothetical protein [Pseudomonas sp.]|uniref:hypothetical protein n=1 Tax=Pseudomonas sp. TaxID=306 RepID=UPI00258CC0F4|nr:hypothetical protein [Pseudomonas sp.]
MGKHDETAEKRGRPCKYPWRECRNVGDGFNVSGKYSTVVFAMKKFAQRNKGYKFSIVEINGEEVSVKRID